MTDDKTGGPAFPMSGDPNVDFDRGMTLWDYFASAALSSYGIADVCNGDFLDSPKKIADRCADIADACIAERKKRGIV